MVESYLYLNNGQFKVSLGSSDSNGPTFEVRTSETAEVFETPQAADWVALLNKITAE